VPSNALGHRDVALVELEVGRPPENLRPLRVRVQLDECARLGRRRRREVQLAGVAAKRRRMERGVREIEPLEAAAREIEQLEAVDRLPREDAGDAAVRQEVVARQVEHPLGVAELSLLLGEGVHLSLALDVQVRPARAIGDEEELAVGSPLRLEDRLGRRTRHTAGVRARAVRHQVADAEVRSLERHVRVIPRQPREARAVRARTRRRVEVTPARDHARLGRAVRW
jgi:hypothetical protein